MKQVNVTIETLEEAIFIRDAITHYCENQPVDTWEFKIEEQWYEIVDLMRNLQLCKKCQKIKGEKNAIRK